MLILLEDYIKNDELLRHKHDLVTRNNKLEQEILKILSKDDLIDIINKIMNYSEYVKKEIKRELILKIYSKELLEIIRKIQDFCKCQLCEDNRNNI